MKVILLHDVKGVGRKDSIVEVAEGYARNYLLPNGFADVATAALTERMRRETAMQGRKKEEDDTALVALADRLKHLRITISAAASSKGTLFGSVTAAMVHSALAKQGYAVPKTAISFTSPINRLGNHAITINLAAAHVETITVTVVADTHHA